MAGLASPQCHPYRDFSLYEHVAAKPLSGSRPAKIGLPHASDITSYR